MMSGRYSFSALSFIAFSAFAVAAVPADPTITAAPLLPRQNSANFIGWVESSSGVWASDTCDPGNTWYQDSKYAQCCPISLASCYAPTACVSGSLIYPYSDLSTTRTIACTDNYKDQKASICNTVFIFENMSDSNAKTDIVCGSASENWSYYRKIPASLTEKASGTSKAVSSAFAGGNVAQKAGGGKSTSKAWIAGAVIGPILGLLIVGALVWFCLRRRKNKNKGVTSQQGGAAMAVINPSGPPAGVGGYTDAKPQFAQQQQQQAFTPDPYANQGAFAAQQNYADAPVSPTTQYHAGSPQYNTGVAPYNAGAAPYNAPVSPPPQQPFYGNDIKQGYHGVPLSGASELGDGGMAGTTPVAHGVSAHQTGELGGNSSQGGVGTFGTSELPGTALNHKPVV